MGYNMIHTEKRSEDHTFKFTVIDDGSRREYRGIKKLSNSMQLREPFWQMAIVFYEDTMSVWLLEDPFAIHTITEYYTHELEGLPFKITLIDTKY